MVAVLEEICERFDRMIEAGRRVKAVDDRPAEPDAGHEGEVDLFRPNREADREKGWEQRKSAVVGAQGS